MRKRLSYRRSGTIGKLPISIACSDCEPKLVRNSVRPSAETAISLGNAPAGIVPSVAALRRLAKVAQPCSAKVTPARNRIWSKC